MFNNITWWWARKKNFLTLIRKVCNDFNLNLIKCNVGSLSVGVDFSATNFVNVEFAREKFSFKPSDSLLFISQLSCKRWRYHRREKKIKVKEMSKIKEPDSSPLTHLNLLPYPPRYTQLFLFTTNIHSFCFHHFVITFNAFLRRCCDFPRAFSVSHATKMPLIDFPFNLASLSKGCPIPIFFVIHIGLGWAGIGVNNLIKITQDIQASAVNLHS